MPDSRHASPNGNRAGQRQGDVQARLVRVAGYVKRAKAQVHRTPAQALISAQRGLAQWNEALPPTWRAELWCLAGRACLEMAQYERSAEYYMQANLLATDCEHASLLVASRVGLGSVMFQIGEMEAALEHYELAMATAVGLDDPLRLRKLWDNIALVRGNLGDLESALALFLESVDDPVHVPLTLVRVLHNLGEILTRQGSAQDALPHLQRALTLADEHQLSSLSLAVAASVGAAQLANGCAAEAMRTLKPALRRAHAAKLVSVTQRLALYLGRALGMAGHHDEALAVLNEAMAKAVELATRTDEQEISHALWQVLRSAGRSHQALAQGEHLLALSRRIDDDHATRKRSALLVRLAVQKLHLEAQVQSANASQLALANQRLELANASLDKALRALGLSQVQPKSDADLAPTLNARERALLKCLGQGMTNVAAAECLGLSPFTVRNQLSTLMHRLGAQTRTQVVAVAIKKGLL